MPNPNAASFSPTITGAVYYVSPSGSDSNPGTLAAPFLTLGRAHTAVAPGGAVYVRAGTYTSGDLYSFAITKSGTSYSNMIHFIAYPGETPVFDAAPSTGLTVNDSSFQLYGNYIYLKGFEVKNSRGMGITLRGHHNVVANCISHDHKSNGILIMGDNGIVEGSTVYRACMSNVNGTGGGTWASGLTAARDSVDNVTDGAIIRNNLVYEIWGEALSVYQATNAIIEDNIVHDGYSACIYISDATGVLCRRNFVYMDPTSPLYGQAYGGSNVGILLGDEVYAPSLDNNTIVNNIVFGCGRNLFWFAGAAGGKLTNHTIANNLFMNSNLYWGIQIDAATNGASSTGPHVNNVVYNNIVIQEGTLPVGNYGGTGGVTWDYNLWSKAAPASMQGAHDKTGDPLIAKTGSPIGDPWITNYYRLTALSPAIGAALAVAAAAVDFYNVTRDSNPDIGASEFVPTNPDPTPTPAGCTSGGTTLAGVLLRVVQYLRPVYYGTATSGDLTSLTDTGRSESEGYYNSGTLFFLSGSLAGKTAVVTNYNGTTKSFTIPTQGAAVAAGDEYAVIDRKYKRADLAQAVNLALAELGPFDQIDQTLVSVLDQEIYTLPAGVANVKRVQFATQAASPYDWDASYRFWKERGGYLYLDDRHLPNVGGLPVRVYYEAPHARVAADCDIISPDVDGDLVAVLAAIYAAKNRAAYAGTSDPEPMTAVQLLTPQYALLRAQRPVRRMQRDTRWPGWVPSSEAWL